MKKLLKIFFCCFYLTKLVSGGRLVPQGRVVKGKKATDGFAPYVVSIQTLTGQYFCAGSIIAPQWILTAAHCIQFPKDSIRVATGSVNRTNPETVYLVAETVLHSLYDQPYYANDIGLLKLDSEIVFDKTTQPIKLAKENNLRDGDKLMMAGWGSELYYSDFVEILRTAEVKYIERDLCLKMVERPWAVSEGHICTDTENGVGACRGDSGGPLIYKNSVLVGIINWGKACARGFPDVYASVAYYYEWINASMNGDIGSQNNTKTFK